MDKLKQLMNRCEYGVHLTINGHRDRNETAEQWIAQQKEAPASLYISNDAQAAILASNTIVDLQFYPYTPVCFYRIVHHDLDKALDEALANLEVEDTQKVAEATSLTVGTRVKAGKQITEGGVDGDESAKFPAPNYIHAKPGDLGTVESIDNDGDPTVRFDRTRTATIVGRHEIHT